MSEDISKNLSFENHPFNDIEKIANDSSEGSSDDGGGSSTGGGAFYVKWVYDETSGDVIPDKTFAETKSAYDNGQVIIFDTGIKYYLPIYNVYEENEDFDVASTYIDGVQQPNILKVVSETYIMYKEPFNDKLSEAIFGMWNVTVTSIVVDDD